MGFMGCSVPTFYAIICNCGIIVTQVRSGFVVVKEKDHVYIQSYKHDGSLHRTWAKGFVIESNATRIVLVTNRALVSEADGRKWITREPAVCFFYPDQWFNAICMIRKTGIHYYCNIASPSLFDGEAIKNIDYDLDVKVSPLGKVTVLDEDEYARHSRKMQYPAKLDVVLHKELERLLERIERKESPFMQEEILELYDRYLMLL